MNLHEPTVRVRPGRFEDAVEEAALHHDVGWCYDEAAVIAEYHDDAYEPSSVLIAELDGRIVGKVELFIARKSALGHFGLIRRFVVHPDFRAQGIGRTLLHAATEQARAAGCSFIELSVDMTNPVAHAFYQREGFSEERVEIMMRKPLDGQVHRTNLKAQDAEWRGQ